MKYESPVSLPENARILVVKMAGIGDLLLATPAIKALRETYPKSTIDILVSPGCASLLNGWSAIHSIIELDKYQFDYPLQVLSHMHELLHLFSFARMLRRKKYDAVFLLHHLILPFGRLKYRLLLKAIHAPYTFGLDNGYGDFLSVPVPDQGFGMMHEAEYYLQVVAAANASTKDKHLYIPCTQENENQARILISSLGFLANAPLLALHPGGGSYSLARRWEPDRFAQVATTLYRESGCQLLLLGGAEEKSLHEYILSKVDTDMIARSVAGTTDLHVTAALLKHSTIFVGNDSSLMHISVAVGTPTIAIFGLTNQQAWGPFTANDPGIRAQIVHLDLPCMPCFYPRFGLGTPNGCATQDCLVRLSSDTVLAAARQMLLEV